MDKKIIDALDEVGLVPADLTKGELSQLTEELAAKERGEIIIDGFFSPSSLYKIMIRKVTQ